MNCLKILTALFSAAIMLTSCALKADEVPENREYIFETKKTVQLPGITTDDVSSAKENAKIINNAIKRADDFTEIILPEGIVYIDDSIKFSSKKNLLFKGGINGTTLVNTSYEPPSPDGKHNSDGIFKIDKCVNLHIEKLTVDYLNHGTCDGVITETKNGRTYFEAYSEFTDGERNPVVGGETVYSVLVADEKVFTKEIWPGDNAKLQKEDDTHFSIPVAFGSVGERICCRISSGSYTSPAIFITNTSGLFLKNIICRSCPSAFIYATYGNADFDFSNINVSAKDGSQALLASNEDCIHIKHLKGFLNIRNCNFKGIGDDALNIHTKLGIVKNVSGSKAEITVNDGGTFPDSFFKEGDTVEFFGRTYKSFGTAKIVSFKGKTAEFESLPEGLKDGYYVQNITASPKVTVENCTVNFGRARGFLIQAKDAEIIGCTFENLRLSAILAAPDFQYWYEGGFTDNLKITGNTFRNCTNAVKGNGFAVVHINSSHDEVQNKANLKGHKDVTVTGNVFEDCKGRLVRATSIVNFVTDSE